MNTTGTQVKTVDISSWKNAIKDDLLVPEIDITRDGNNQIRFYSEEAERFYDVRVNRSNDKNRYVDIVVTAQTNRKNIFSRIIGAVTDAFERLTTSGMEFGTTRANQIKDNIENDILKRAKKTGMETPNNITCIEDGFKAATQLNNKLGIDDTKDETRFELAKSLHQNHSKDDLLNELNKDCNEKKKALGQKTDYIERQIKRYDLEMKVTGINFALDFLSFLISGDKSAGASLVKSIDNTTNSLYYKSNQISKLNNQLSATEKSILDYTCVINRIKYLN